MPGDMGSYTTYYSTWRILNHNYNLTVKLQGSSCLTTLT